MHFLVFELEQIRIDVANVEIEVVRMVIFRAASGLVAARSRSGKFGSKKCPEIHFLACQTDAFHYETKIGGFQVKIIKY